MNNVAKIFEPFFTIREVGKAQGWDLRWHTVIKQHYGYINVYSESERRTAFRIYLPAIMSTEEVTVRI